MTDARHSKQTLADGIHGMVAYTYANAAARLAATGFDSSDLYKVALQEDTNDLYLLVNISPIEWIDFGSAGLTTKLNRVRIDCRKGTVGTLAVGKVVYVSGYDAAGEFAYCELAQANSASTMPAVGIIDQQATDSSTGTVLITGVLDYGDTSGFTQGLPIYVSAATPGEITQTAPAGPAIVQALGVVLCSDSGDGHIGVNVLGYRAYDYVSTPQPLGTAAAGTSNLASPSDHVHANPIPNEQKVLYVGKHGNDSNDGLSITKAFLTFGAAIAYAQSQVPSPVNAFNIKCSDSGAYTEDITVYSYIVVTAPAATLIGEISLRDYAGVEFLQVRVGAGETAVSKTVGTETSSFKASGITATGSGNAIKNDGTDSVIICELDYINVEDGDAVHDNSSGSGHIHVRVSDIYINGDGKGLVTAGGAGLIYALASEIEDVGSGTVTAIDVQTGKVRCQVSRIAADTAWSVASGATLEAFVGSYTGSVTEAGTVEVTIAGDAGAEVSDTPPVNVTKATASAGTSPDASRQDHKHDVTTAAPGATGVATASAEGSATSLARSDHAHQSNTAPVAVTKATAAIGTSGEPARADHKHDVTTTIASAQVPGDSAAEGSATSLARSDHKHSLPAYGTTSGTFCQGDDSRLSDARPPAELTQTSSESTSTTTATSPQQKVRLTTGTLVSGKLYRIEWCYEWNHNSGSTNSNQRVQIDDTTTIAEISQEPQDTTNWHSEGGFYYFTGTGAAINIDIDYWVASGGTSSIRRARIQCTRAQV